MPKSGVVDLPRVTESSDTPWTASRPKTFSTRSRVKKFTYGLPFAHEAVF